MTTVNVEASKAYEVVIGPGLLGKTGDYIKKLQNGSVAAIVTDKTVDALYGQAVEDSLAGSGYRVVKYVSEPGEKSKSAENYIALLNFLASRGLTRTDVIIALGGGVPGDLAGFAAATYLRGIGLVQLPTTLLAAVDSSVGGKTAIDLDAGKNLAGAFYQPDLVLSDFSTLSTLPSEIFSDGCAEVIKYGVISDRALFERLQSPIRPQLEEIIARCVSIKRDIVCKDEHDTGLRQLLNFGHTVGHAVEVLSAYGVSHGSAVAIGMVIVTRASRRLGICGEDCYRQVLSMVKRHGLPTETGFDARALYTAALSDKKRSGGTMNLIVPLEIGRCTIKKIAVEELFDFIALGISE